MKSAKTITQGDKFRKRLVQQFYTKGIQGISKYWLGAEHIGTDNHSSIWWEELGS